MSIRPVKQVIQSTPTVEGAGVRLRRAFGFPDFHRTMGFLNAVAWIANAEDHHPDVEAGYNYCRLAFSTHSIGGLSENDFILAAKIDELPIELK